MRPKTKTIQLHHHTRNNPFTKKRDLVTVEAPLEIRIRGKSLVITMRTPGDDPELAAGFLYTEGLINHSAEIREIAHCKRQETENSENILNVFLSPSTKIDLKKTFHYGTISTSCGICGKTSIEAVHQHFPPIESNLKIKTNIIYQLPSKLNTIQTTFKQTGGLHAAAIFDYKGKLIVSREDVGRHNAVDKVIGYGLLKKHLPYSSNILLVSGRASFEIMQKALAAQIAIVVAISAPSSLAIEFAQESNQTLIGFLRNNTMNIYCCSDRLV